MELITAALVSYRKEVEERRIDPDSIKVTDQDLIKFWQIIDCPFSYFQWANAVDLSLKE